MRALSILAILAAIVATPAEAGRKPVRRPPLAPPSAVEPPDSLLRIEPSADGRVLRVTGWLDIGSFIKLRRIQVEHPRASSVVLASAGGVVQEGALLGEAIRTARLDTHVESLCASACTLAFAAGAKRTIGTEAWLGFDRARWVAGPSGAPAPGGAAGDTDLLQRAAFRRAGFSADFIATAMAVPADTIWFPDSATLLGAGVIALEARPAATAGKAAEARAAELRAQPLWQAAERRAPAAFAGAVALAWRLDAAAVDRGTIMAEAQAGLVRSILPQIAAAPPPLVDRFLASLSRSDGDGCARAGWGARLMQPDRQAPLDSILIRILEADAEGAPAADERAMARLVRRVAKGHPGLRATSDPALRCRAGLDFIRPLASAGARRAMLIAYAASHRDRQILPLPL
ncbi:hypothetical protein [Sphingopyxis granuli]|uniref:hypothetical protein n=1 Tax=Sphingopyxis granuli TaxID=267128 RepID=UPI001A44AEA5|nr:hypothetical protein [Sphingopyxis granuli]MBL8649936.1 hypothetical protein [Sphingopyxis sp.]QUM74611.1 hypothetical protein ICN83_20805 [Sphingopyxis granuli]